MQQGLLPSTNKRGPGTKYGLPLLDRLRLIKLLQRRHLPLTEIRNQLESLDENGVREALGGLPELPLPDSSVAYARSVLSRGEPSGAFREDGPLFAASAAEVDPIMPMPKPATTKSTWERIRLSRDVELHIRRPLTRERNKLVDRLLDAAKNIFSEEP